MSSQFLTSSAAGRVASRYMNTYAQRQGESLQRLSSGSRVYAAKDDPSALAIGTKIQSERLALRASAASTELASSMLQVASSGMNSLLENLTAMRGLTVRATSGAISASERGLIQEEFEQLRQNIDQIADSVKFGGRALLSNAGNYAVISDGQGEYSSPNTLSINSAFNGSGAATTSLDLVEGLTRGHFLHSFSTQVDVEVEEENGALTATIQAGEHTLTATTNGLQAGDAFILKSDDGYTQLAFTTNSTAANFNTILTKTGLESNLQTLLSSATLSAGSEASLSGALPASISGLNLLMSAGSVQGTIANTSITGTTGDQTVSFTIGGELFMGQGLSLTDNNTIVLNSANSPGRKIAIDLGTGAPPTAGNFNGLQVDLGTAASAIGLVASTNAFSNSAADLRGFITGTAQDLTVERGQSGGTFNIRLTLDTGQVFEARDEVPAASGRLSLRDVNDSSNLIALDYAGNVSNLSNVSGFQSSLAATLDLNAGGTPARFVSESAYYSNSNGFSSEINVSLKGIGGASPGTYAFSYDAGTGYFKLNDGERTFKAQASDQETQVVAFGNGIAVSLGQTQDNLFDHNQNIEQVVFSVENLGDGGTFRFQVSPSPDGILEFQIADSSATGLGLSNVSVADETLANSAATQIEAAMAVLNVSMANIGSLQQRMDVMNENLEMLNENMATAQSILLDVDIGYELTQQAKFQVLAETAASMFYRAQQVPSRLAEIILR